MPQIDPRIKEVYKQMLSIHNQKCWTISLINAIIFGKIKTNLSTGNPDLSIFFKAKVHTFKNGYKNIMNSLCWFDIYKDKFKSTGRFRKKNYCLVRIYELYHNLTIFLHYQSRNDIKSFIYKIIVKSTFRIYFLANSRRFL